MEIFGGFGSGLKFLDISAEISLIYRISVRFEVMSVFNNRSIEILENVSNIIDILVNSRNIVKMSRL